MVEDEVKLYELHDQFFCKIPLKSGWLGWLVGLFFVFVFCTALVCRSEYLFFVDDIM